MPALANIEGIGETYSERLAQARIGSTQTLLKRGATRKGRQQIAKATGIRRQLILDWVNRADLFRIDGVGEEYSDLLEASGVDTVAELANRNAKNLLEKMAQVNIRQRLVRRIPSLSQVANWIGQAKRLPRMVEY